jgi:hypothetical protein
MWLPFHPLTVWFLVNGPKSSAGWPCTIAGPSTLSWRELARLTRVFTLPVYHYFFLPKAKS